MHTLSTYYIPVFLIPASFQLNYDPVKGIYLDHYNNKFSVCLTDHLYILIYLQPPHVGSIDGIYPFSVTTK